MSGRVKVKVMLPWKHCRHLMLSTHCCRSVSETRSYFKFIRKANKNSSLTVCTLKKFMYFCYPQNSFRLVAVYAHNGGWQCTGPQGLLGGPRQAHRPPGAGETMFFSAVHWPSRTGPPADI